MLNITLLVLAFLSFARLQFRFELRSFLFAPARERIMSVSRLAALQLPDTPQAGWSNLLRQYSARYPAQFYLFDEDGAQLAGNTVQLPASVLRQMEAGRSRHSREDRFRREAAARGMGRGPDFGRFPGEFPGGFRPGPPPDSGGRLEPPPDRPHFGLTDAPMTVMKTSDPPEYWAGVRIPLWIADREDPIHGVIVWRIPSLWTEPFFFDYRPWLTISLVVIVVSAICWVPLVRGLTHSVSTMTDATKRIADGHFDIKLPTKRRDELGRLSDSINRMAERLSGYVSGQKRFLSDVAHELSSPLARMQVALSILEERTPGEQTAAYIADVHEEVQHMSTLVSELLSFSKSQVVSPSAQLQPVAVGAIVERVLQRESTDQSTIDVAVAQNITVLADPDYLFRALANVVRNAVRYAGAAGAIQIVAVREEDAVRITVADQGPGIPEAELENIFRPFYRPEFARQRETGGTGLGLAIVRESVESCGGSVVCRNRAPQGLEVAMEFPAAT